MTDADLIKQAIADLDTAIAARLAKSEPGVKDCIGDCASAYDACWAKAGSDAEKLACKAAYNKCIANC